MIILTIRTDKPESEIGLYDDKAQVAYQTWQAHRQLAETIHRQIVAMLESRAKKIGDIQGIVVFQGPGSFTGLRIGLTVANTLAYALDIPVVASQGEQWLHSGIERLAAGDNDRIALPEYGGEANITVQKK